MKYYETQFEEYVHAVKKYNLHPELTTITEKLPESIAQFPNIILYGPSGVGKYSQVLNIIQRYSPSKFKYDKKIFISNEKNDKKAKTAKDDSTKKTSSSNKSIALVKKNEYMYRISDIHYEIDMATLGCNAKTLWHDIFFQIIDIISVKPNKTGIIVCKNFHMIYNELLDVFYSYIRHPFYNIQVFFIIITDHISFIPDSMLKTFLILPVMRPTVEQYTELMKYESKTIFGQNNPYVFTNGERASLTENINQIRLESITNIKELHILKKTDLHKLPEDVFNIVTDTIIRKVLSPSTIQIQDFRNDLYDLLIYNIDVADVVFYIVAFLLEKNILNSEITHEILQHSHTFLKYYNNNYRPIYHLENIIYFIIYKIHFNTSF
jgi:hypothetical protein